MEGMLFHAFVYLAAAVLAVPVAHRLGLGSVLGYLIAGILIGPVLGLVGAETKDIQQVAEFGVVLMLFLVGLELEPKLLWQMRGRLLGLGGLQVGLTALAIAALAFSLGLYWGLGLAVGLVFAMSSTAIVIQTLSEKGLTKTEGGRASFAVLLFQDISVIAVLALIPFLAQPEPLALAAWLSAAAGDNSAAQGAAGLVAGLPNWGYALVVLGAVATVVLGGHYLSRPLFRYIAESRLREVFTASALLLVVGTALLMTLVGLSPALGTFLAGVILATSEFRHELRSDIEPFKGILMGIFFITVGAGIDLPLLFGDFATLLGLTLGVMGLKALVLLALARLFRLRAGDRWLFALSLAQAGEFGFVLLGFCVQNGVVPTGLARTLSLVVALSMLLTPALFILYDRLIAPRLRNGKGPAPDTIEEEGTVVIAGIGRFGQIVNRLLVAAGIETVVLDHRADQIDLLRKLGIKSYYGDASRPDLLHAAGLARARLFIVAIDDRDRAVEMVDYCRRTYPQVRILARAYDVGHLYLLKQAGADLAVREVFDTSLGLGAAALRELGMHPYKVERMTRAFRRHEAAGLAGMYDLWDQDPDIARNLALQARIREHVGTLQDALNSDRMQLHDRTERGWTPPSRGFSREPD
ncbi:monovalent cation:proton antiporter-2 (CPA2) family protein [uncultured Thiodictyon sp.]|uniref:monovalent cation:proton antiporter-2 (CPA2) family protein n=1 Tax=uncultured Thiodictyon sp. TaxID=1846217 RepID=UPI0025FBAB00|nr:monovalent cation:proton antiporter-2 (CPA2) family protein [uncultured Thiodictyon sp.]